MSEQPTTGTSPTAPPRARRVPITREHHGDVVQDAYEWLRAKEDPAVREYLEAENAWTAHRTAHLAALRGTLFDEIKTRTQESDLSVPSRDGDWWYYWRTVEGAQYPLFCRVPVGDAADWTPPVPPDGAPLPGEQVLLDGNTEATGHPFFAFGPVAVSPDGRWLAWASDVAGDERYTLRVRDLDIGNDLPGQIANTSYAVAWASDCTTLFYLSLDDAWRPHQVWRHQVGLPHETDVLVHTEADERFWLSVGRTRSGRYVLVSSGSKTTSESWVIPADEPAAQPRLVLGRREGVEYTVEHAVIGGQDRFLLLHNEQARDFRLDMTQDARLPVPPSGQWSPVLEHREGTRLEQVDAFAGFLAVGYRHEALPRVAVIRLDDATTGAGRPVGPGRLEEVGFGEALSSAHLVGGRMFDQPMLRMVQTSFITPATVYDLHVPTGRLLLRRRTPVLGGYDPAGYEQFRTWATAPDGTRVPVSVVRRVGVAGDGTAPGLLYGYGAYEISIDPAFSVSRLSLLDRGVVFAVAHVRGGGELGRQWYEGGKKLAKPNTFSDFVSVADHLDTERWVDGRRLVAMGGSAGGLLMGAVANTAPERFVGILAAVPFVDPLTSMLDESLPLTALEQDEWGDPIRDPAVYVCMKGYAPYDNVGRHAYPAMLVTTSLNDTRVLYVEPAKWVARLRELAPGSHTVLLKTEMDAGHGGRSGRYEEWRERAYDYAWALDVLGLA